MIVHSMPQRSPEWYAAHVGRLTGSGAEDATRDRKRGTGELEGRIKLRRRLVAERLTGAYEQSLIHLPTAMQRGIDLEGMAFNTYEAVTGQLVKRVGFVAHEALMVGCSPDGYVGDFIGGIELKCPNSATHLEYWQAGGIPEDYLAQVRLNLWVTGAQWWDFVSFDDRFQEPDLRMYRERLWAKDAGLVEFEQKALAFLADVDRDYGIAIGRQWERAAAAVA